MSLPPRSGRPGHDAALDPHPGGPVPVPYQPGHQLQAPGIGRQGRAISLTPTWFAHATMMSSRSARARMTVLAAHGTPPDGNSLHPPPSGPMGRQPASAPLHSERKTKLYKWRFRFDNGASWSLRQLPVRCSDALPGGARFTNLCPPCRPVPVSETCARFRNLCPPREPASASLTGVPSTGESVPGRVSTVGAVGLGGGAAAAAHWRNEQRMAGLADPDR